MFRLFEARKQNRKIVDRLYAEIVEAAREPALYIEMGLADTVMGRFEALTIHVYLILARCRGEPSLQALAQDLVDRFIADLDRSMRELGVGDLSVPKKMRHFAGMFYKRVAAYDAAIVAGDREALGQALAAHALPEATCADAADRLADYMLTRKSSYEALAAENFLRGELSP
ncbi:ubiquinol-cytochrome C chaperone family protein [Consotaella salsifontis]|nr:ubiquinol-cytochrome C chaperone family protein [Consotaella salsifontis]